MSQQKSEFVLEVPQQSARSVEEVQGQNEGIIVIQRQVRQSKISDKSKTKSSNKCNLKKSRIIISLQVVIVVILLLLFLKMRVQQSKEITSDNPAQLDTQKAHSSTGNIQQTMNKESNHSNSGGKNQSTSISTVSIIQQTGTKVQKKDNKEGQNRISPSAEEKGSSMVSPQKISDQSSFRQISSNSSESQSSFDWPSDMSDYNMSESFNLWDVTPEQKTAWLKRYKELPQSKKPRMTENYLEISYDKDGDFEHQAKSYEANTEVINWADIQLTEQQKVRIESEFNANREKRREKITNLFNKYKRMYMGRTGFMEDSNKKLTYQQFLDSLEYEQLLGEDYKNDPKFKAIFEKEKKYYESKYKVQDYPNELRACIVCPSYRNVPDYRYAWNIESIMQQDYSNFRVIVIDDASPDKTGEVLSKYLRWRNFPRDKIVLLRNRAQRTSIENVYYAVHKYCDFNQIFYTVDGDDEMAGTQVLRLFNSLYQSKKYYTMYSNFLSYWYRRSSPLSLGISLQYSEQTKIKNNYRHSRHAYSHLRTMMTDVFLLAKDESFKDWNGKFYWTIPDNAVYYAAMEMSCGRVNYIPELALWYNVETGYSQISTSRQKERGKINEHIINSQKHYHCVNNYFEIIKAVLSKEGKVL